MEILLGMRHLPFHLSFFSIITFITFILQLSAFWAAYDAPGGAQFSSCMEAKYEFWHCITFG